VSRRARGWLAGIVAVAALAAGVGVATRHFVDAGPGISAEPFFVQTFRDLDGRPVDTAPWKNHVVVVNFWATWCPPCIEEMPDLQRVHDEYAGRGVIVVGLGIDAPSALKRFRDERGLTLPLVAAGAAGSELGRTLGNTAGALPFTVVIGRDGRIVRSRLGQVRPAELRRWLDTQIGVGAG
jgi:thiol-disulfide isomerase/thioredoxin